MEWEGIHEFLLLTKKPRLVNGFLEREKDLSLRVFQLVDQQSCSGGPPHPEKVQILEIMGREGWIRKNLEGGTESEYDQNI